MAVWALLAKLPVTDWALLHTQGCVAILVKLVGITDSALTAWLQGRGITVRWDMTEAAERDQVGYAGKGEERGTTDRSRRLIVRSRGVDIGVYKLKKKLRARRENADSGGGGGVKE